MRPSITLIPTLAILLVALPLAGIALDGRELGPYLDFPPRTTPARHAPFSWGVFFLLTALVLVCLAPLVHRILTCRRQASEVVPCKRAFPWWGWPGLALLLLAWVVAWNRFSWFAPLQRHTFTPIWLGYILVVNALTAWRTGRCLLLAHPRRFLALFPLSALFWWFFEFLNRFVQNWFYVGVAGLEPWQYFWEATLPFATVLPAVLSTSELLASFPRLHAGLGDAWRVDPGAPRALALITLAASAAVLTAIGVRPEILYPMVWVAPLLILLCLQALWRIPTILAPLARGDWREPWLAALAALVCGFLWELWNVHSLAHWVYAIPYVHRFQIFEMPLLGYAGYLPFGLQCLAAGSLLGGRVLGVGESGRRDAFWTGDSPA